MKKIGVILFLAGCCSAFALVGNFGSGNVGNALTFNGAPVNTPAFGDGSEIVAGSFDAYGNFVAVGVNPDDYYNGVVFNLDTNSFSVIGGTVYSKGLLNGGTYPSLSTNLVNLFANFSFATNNRVIIGAVPSFKSIALSGGFSSVGGMTPPTYPSPQISIDGGLTWQTPTPVTVPALVSLYDGTGNRDGFTNVTVNSFVNPATQGQTNDLTGQVVYVSGATDGKSPVPLSQANAISASATTQWSRSPAVATVNLSGNGLVLSADWTLVSSNQSFVWRADGTDFAVMTPAVTAGQAPVFKHITVNQTNCTFQIFSMNVPTIQWAQLAPSYVGWTNLPSQSNYQSGGYWYVTAPTPIWGGNISEAFRASVTGTNTAPATFVAHAQFFADSLILTNASGARFAVSVNSTTNGLTFTPQ